MYVYIHTCISQHATLYNVCVYIYVHNQLSKMDMRQWLKHHRACFGPGPCPLSGPASVQAHAHCQGLLRSRPFKNRTAAQVRKLHLQAHLQVHRHLHLHVLLHVHVQHGEIQRILKDHAQAGPSDHFGLLLEVPLHVPTQLTLHELLLQEHQVEVARCCWLLLLALQTPGTRCRPAQQN
jgi:hypothetical protein